MQRMIINILLFQATWFAAIFGAAQGHAWPGPLFATITLVIHLLMRTHRAVEARLVLSCALIGFVVDCLWARLGILSFAAEMPRSWPCPLWMLSIWIGFATTLNGGLARLQRRFLLAAVIGGVSGPIAYSAAESIGAILIHGSRVPALCLIGGGYAVLLPIMLRLASACVKRRGAVGNACVIASTAEARA
ncbi:MAG: DUF2878 domain-containing protein [Phycisphaerae bacterium]|nr:DUF2878 domain-containing protein [Phycisphaerae bacterium]